jgi:DNA-binding SARP family transcriptional activator
MGDKIPYIFHDIESFSDLYYSPVSNKFIAVTCFAQDSTNHTVASIYTLDGAPVPEEIALAAVTPVSSPYYIYYIILALIALTAGTLLIRRRRLSPQKEGHHSIPIPLKDPIRDNIPDDNPNEVPAERPAAAIYLFGDLQVFDKEGNDLTRQFSPLLKELFLLILLYSIKNGRGISSEKLNEILWFDKSEKSARNNRSVNIAKLKSILDKTGGCELSKDTGYWKIGIQSGLIAVDYQDYVSIVNNKKVLDRQRVTELAAITKRGGFLSNIEYAWLDPFKSEVSNHVIDTYLHFAESVVISDDPEFIITLADYIFYFDAANEEAMQMKCKALVYLGKHSLAKQSYESFVKEYKSIYGEDFGKDFQKCIS